MRDEPLPERGPLPSKELLQLSTEGGKAGNQVSLVSHESRRQEVGE